MGEQEFALLPQNEPGAVGKLHSYVPLKLVTYRGEF